jgi:starvation-inducible DNA-binding protein
MLKELVADQATVVSAAKRVVEAAEAAGDQASADLGVRRIDVHEKNAWMLRSHLE